MGQGPPVPLLTSHQLLGCLPEECEGFPTAGSAWRLQWHGTMGFVAMAQHVGIYSYAHVDLVKYGHSYAQIEVFSGIICNSLE